MCVISGSQIKMFDGTSKPVEQINIGEEVVTLSREKGKVIKLFQREVNEKLYRVETDYGYIITATGNHPLRADPSGTDKEEVSHYIRVDELKLDDFIFCDVEGIYGWTAIKTMTLFHHHGKVFNLDLDKDHCYFANGVAVHSCNCNVEK